MKEPENYPNNFFLKKKWNAYKWNEKGQKETAQNLKMFSQSERERKKFKE